MMGLLYLMIAHLEDAPAHLTGVGFPQPSACAIPGYKSRVLGVASRLGVRAGRKISQSQVGICVRDGRLAEGSQGPSFILGFNSGSAPLWKSYPYDLWGPGASSPNAS